MQHVEVKSYYRGVAFDSLNHLIKSRLSLSNPDSIVRFRGSDNPPPGLFFVPAIESATSWAQEKAKALKKPLTGIVSVIITPINLELVRQYLWNVHIEVGGRRAFRNEYLYSQSQTFNQLLTGQICIDINSMSDTVLFELSTQVGLLTGNELQFVLYRDLRKRFLQGGYEGDLPFFLPHGKER